MKHEQCHFVLTILEYLVVNQINHTQTIKYKMRYMKQLINIKTMTKSIKWHMYSLPYRHRHSYICIQEQKILLKLLKNREA